MTDTSHRPEQAGGSAGPAVPEERSTAWVGWVVFGGVMLIMVGLVHVVQGLVALLDDEKYLVTQGGLLVNVDFTVWGWVHLLLGIVAALTGAGLLTGNMLARIIGVGIAGLSALVNLAFMPAYPVWSSIAIALDVVVIYAIVVHGREVRSQRY
jgi:hypothetical protein